MSTGDNGTRICGARSIECYYDAEIKLFKDIETGNSNQRGGRSYFDKCNCLPACTSIEYEATVQGMKYDMNVIKHTVGSRMNITFVSFHFDAWKESPVL